MIGPEAFLLRRTTRHPDEDEAFEPVGVGAEDLLPYAEELHDPLNDPEAAKKLAS
jgi:hypothetical protein